MGHPVRQAGQVLIDAWAAEHPDCQIIVTDGQLNAQKQAHLSAGDLVVDDTADLHRFICQHTVKAQHGETGLGSRLQDGDQGGAAGRDDIKVVGYDGQKDALESVMAGKLYGTARKVVEFPYSLDMAYEYLTTGKIVDNDVNLPPIKIDASTTR